MKNAKFILLGKSTSHENSAKTIFAGLNRFQNRAFIFG